MIKQTVVHPYHGLTTKKYKAMNFDTHNDNHEAPENYMSERKPFAKVTYSVIPFI